MKRLTYLAPTGMLGGGFTEANFRAALRPELAFIGCDAGSCDGGPSYLGANRYFQSRAAVKRDLRLLTLGARSLGIPLLIGSCGGSGGDWNLQWTWEILQEIAREEDLHFKTALIHAEPPRDVLLEKWRANRFRPLDPAPPLDEDILRTSDHIVAMMGAEAYIAALAGGADVVLAGRSTDASVFAAIPLREGYDPGLCWHAAKITECGGAAVTQMDRPDGMLCTLEAGRFILEPNNPQQRCSPLSVASHALYETGNPFLMKEPGGTLDLRGARYEALSDRSVAVAGSVFRREPYTVRMEGAKLAGYQAMVIGGIRDPVLLARFDSWLGEVTTALGERVDHAFGRPMHAEYKIIQRVYGRDAVLGSHEPRRAEIGHEVGLSLTVLAASQEMATAIAGMIGHVALHHAVPEWHGLVSNLAFPLSPHVVPLGPAYRFTLNHVVELDDPLEFFPIQYEKV
jgi:hypothetical protein